MYEKILVPIDGSDTAGLGLAEAIKLAKAQAGRIRLIHVLDVLPALAPPVGAAGADVVIAQMRGGGESILKDAEASARNAGVPADSKLIEETGGQAGEHILQEAASWPADLIVCGTHGRRGIRRLVLGSDAEYIVRRSSVPVLLVPSRPMALP